jgi:hypothetical protein
MKKEIKFTGKKVMLTIERFFCNNFSLWMVYKVLRQIKEANRLIMENITYIFAKFLKYLKNI